MKNATLFIVMLLLLPSSAVAQKHFSDLNRISEAIKERIRDEMKDWKCHDIEPLTFGDTPPSDDLRIQQWMSGSRDARLVLHRHPSAAEAVMALRQFAGSRIAHGHVHGLADEAYMHSPRGKIVVRKGNLLVYISAIVIKETYTEAERKDPRYATGLDLEQEAVLTRAFAQHVAAALQSR